MFLLERFSKLSLLCGPLTPMLTWQLIKMLSDTHQIRVCQGPESLGGKSPIPFHSPEAAFKDKPQLSTFKFRASGKTNGGLRKLRTKPADSRVTTSTSHQPGARGPWRACLLCTLPARSKPQSDAHTTGSQRGTRQNSSIHTPLLRKITMPFPVNSTPPMKTAPGVNAHLLENNRYRKWKIGGRGDGGGG